MEGDGRGEVDAVVMVGKVCELSRSWSEVPVEARLHLGMVRALPPRRVLDDDNLTPQN